MALINATAELLRAAWMLLSGELHVPERRGRHAQAGTAPAGWSPLSADVRRQIAPTFYGGAS
jgi:hypothetical protein